MSQLEVRFTLKGEQSEKTFFLRNEGENFYLMGDSADSEKYAVQKDDFTNIFTLVDQKNLPRKSLGYGCIDGIGVERRRIRTESWHIR